MSSLSKKTMPHQVSEDPHVHFQDVKPNIPDLDYMSLWESFKSEYIPQATSSPIKQVSSVQEKQREKTVHKEPESVSTEDEQIAQLLQIRKQADEQLQKLLLKKKHEAQGAIPKKSTSKKPASPQLSTTESSSTDSSSDSEDEIYEPRKLKKHQTKSHTCTSESNADSDEETCARQKRSRQGKETSKSKKSHQSETSGTSGVSDNEAHKKQKSKKSSSEEETRKKHKSHKTKKSKSSIIRQLPRNLTYDGKGSWMAFKEKFTRYAKTCEWTKKECLNYLCWCLTDKASDFYALLMESSDRWTYSRLLRRLEERFGIKELDETAQHRFQQATQNVGESLEDWSDRIMTLGVKAFKTLPERYARRQAVSRFCEGLLDREAGLSVSVDDPPTIEIAINKVRRYQHVHSSVYGKSGKRDKRSAIRDEEQISVKAVQESAAQASDIKSIRGESAGTSEKSLAEIVQDLAKQMEILNKKISGPQFRATPHKVGTCYNCGVKGHFKKDCPNLKPRQESGKDLNGKGSGKKANPRSYRK